MALNRPFSRFCRHCRNGIGTETTSLRSVIGWSGSGNPGVIATAPADGVLLADLSRIDGDKNSLPKSIVQLRFIDGILAVHRPGGFLAVVHPFPSAATTPENRAVIWSESEQLKCPPQGRAFAPFKLPDDRYLIFSTSRAIYRLDPWTLDGWSFNPQRESSRVLLECPTKQDGVVIAAAPVPLAGSKLGVLLSNRANEYRWITLDSNAGGSPELSSFTGVDIRISGAPCSVEMIPGEAVAFATPAGHWIWRMSDALESRATAIIPTIDDAKGREPLVPDAQVRSGNELFFGKQRILIGSAGQRRWMTWYYQRTRDHHSILEKYSVALPDLQVEPPCLVDNLHELVPLGISSDNNRMLLLREDRVCREIANGFKDLGPAEKVQNLAGLQCENSVIVSVMRNESGESIAVRSLDDLDQTVKFKKVERQFADPLQWSRFLFTIELSQNRLTLRRRDLDRSTISSAAVSQ